MTKQKTSLRGVAIAALAAASLSFPLAAFGAEPAAQGSSATNGMQVQSGMHKKSMGRMAHMKKTRKHHMRTSRRTRHRKHERKLYGSTRMPSMHNSNTGNSLKNVAPTLPSQSSKGTMSNTAPTNSQ